MTVNILRVRIKYFSINLAKTVMKTGCFSKIKKVTNFLRMKKDY